MTVHTCPYCRCPHEADMWPIGYVDRDALGYPLIELILEHEEQQRLTMTDDTP